MPAPSEYPEWASGGSAAITDPTLAEKQLGWTGGEEPPAEYFNWWMNLVYLWIVWLASQVTTPTLHTVGGAGEPAYQNSFSGSAGFSVSADGKTCRLWGDATVAALATPQPFQLPAGSRPASNRAMGTTISDGSSGSNVLPAVVAVHTDGSVVVSGGTIGNQTTVHLEGLTFRLDV